MKLFLINLPRRQDRLQAMTTQMAKLGLAFETVAAIDAAAVPESWIERYFTPTGPLGKLPKGDRCCSLSHKKAWAAFLASDAPYAVFLEDDVVLDSAAAKLLAQSDWLPENTDIMKLEHFGPQHQRVLTGKRKAIGGGRSVARLLSRHTGAAAYILSRRAALRLMETVRWSVPVDHLLFNANVSKLAAELKPYQLLPAIARQADGGSSDIKHFRLADRHLSLGLIRRELVRAYYELRLLPRQLAKIVSGQARLMRVAAPIPAPTVPALRFDLRNARGQAWSSARLENRV